MQRLFRNIAFVSIVLSEGLMLHIVHSKEKVLRKGSSSKGGEYNERERIRKSIKRAGTGAYLASVPETG